MPVAPLWSAPEPAKLSLWHGDALAVMRQWPAASVDLVLTDPPYFIDGMDDGWNKKKLARKTKRARTVGSLPVGMKFDPQQGRRLQAFLSPIFEEAARVLKPGGFLVSFSQARLYHRMGVAAEDAGFEVRDMLGWTYEGQAKAFSQDHFIARMDIPQHERDDILAKLANRKTPQLKPMIEPMVFAQKPRSGTFIQNWLDHEVGLIDTTQRWEGRFPGNLMACAKPSQEERGPGNDHPTVKPLALLGHLIRLLTVPGAVVADPFVGSGSTLLAALANEREGWGVEKTKAHVGIARRRITHAMEAN